MADQDPVALLKDFLHAHDERPSAFATRIGVDQSTFFHILSGRRRPGRDNAIAIENGTRDPRTGLAKVPASAWGDKKRRGSKKASAAA